MIKRESLKRFWPYVKPHTTPMAIAMLLAIPMAAIRAAPVTAVKYLIDKVLVEKDSKALILIPLGIIAVSAVNFFIRFYHYYLIRSAANRITQQLRNDLYSNILKLSIGYFNDARGGVIVSRVTNDVQIIVRTVSNLINLVREPLTFLGLLIYALILNWKLALLTLTTVPLVTILFANTGKHSRRYSDHILTKMGEMSAHLSETISGMRVIQSFNLEGFMRGQFMQYNREFTRTALKAITVEELSHPGVEFICGMAIALLLYFGGKEVLSGHMTAGEIISFFACFGMMVQPLRMFNELNISFNQCAAAADNVFEILDTKPGVESKPNAPRLAPFNHEIGFQNITLSYPGADQPVLKNFSLTVKKGEVLALVGASGAGKTTVLSLLPRFFDPQSGKITIDGQEIRDCSLDSLRAQVALVTQEVFLFHDTIRNNIRAGNHSVTDEQIRRAADSAQATSFIDNLPQGLDTVIGDRGQKLSGGERQRISIARAILKDAPILLLDEATSALDSENERLVQAALDRLMTGKTALVVAHRLSTIRKADRILVMEKGAIVEKGALMPGHFRFRKDFLRL